MTAITASGEVPREAFKGVVWDSAAEAEFRTFVVTWLDRFPALAEDARVIEQISNSARWEVELTLIHKIIRTEVEAAGRAFETVDKLRLRDDWRAKYGWQMTETLLRVAKDPGRFKVYLA